MNQITIFVYIYYSFSLLLICISIICISKTKQILNNIEELNNEDINIYFNRIILFPIIQLITTLYNSFYRVFEIYSRDFNLTLDIIHIIICSLRGIFFLILFFISSGVFNIIFRNKISRKSQNKKNLNATFLLLEGSFISSQDLSNVTRDSKESNNSLN